MVVPVIVVRILCGTAREAEVDEHPRLTNNKATLDAGSDPKRFLSEPTAQRY